MGVQVFFKNGWTIIRESDLKKYFLEKSSIFPAVVDDSIGKLRYIGTVGHLRKHSQYIQERYRTNVEELENFTNEHIVSRHVLFRESEDIEDFIEYLKKILHETNRLDELDGCTIFKKENWSWTL